MDTHRSFGEGAPGRLLTILVAIQVAAVLVAIFVPFGFDHPSELGLDFGHLLVLATVYGCAFLVGLATSAARRRWLALALQLAPPTLLVALAASGRLAL